MRFSRTLALIAMLFATASAHAQGGPLRGACKNDIQSLCGGVQAGGGRIRDCMREHRDQLSTACKVAIADRMLERNAHRAAPGPAPEAPAPGTPTVVRP